MNDQLTEMKSSGQQTDKLLYLYSKQVEGIEKLVEQEKRYASAAEKTLDATIVSNRPWVGPVTATVDGPIVPGVGNAHLMVVNTGRTPARILRFRGAQSNVAKVASNPPFPNTTRFPENSHPILVPGSVVEVQFPFVLPSPINEEIRQGKRRFYIYGIVDYQAVDDRSKTFSTKICYFWTLTDKNQFAACQEYNDAN